MELWSIELVGWLASFLFSICGVPQAWQCYKTGHADGLNDFMLWGWLGGEVLMTIYVYGKHGWDLPLLANYFFNFCCLVIILRYRYFPRDNNNNA